MASSFEIDRQDIVQEVELLQAIYIHELEIFGPVERPTCLKLALHPSTEDNDNNLKYVCLELHLVIPEKYPFVIPEITIQNPRGLSEAHVKSIQDNLFELAKAKKGSPMLYDLIEYTKESLTDNNIPSCPCVICLEHFHEQGMFIKTICYHYFHIMCLKKYIDHFVKENKKVILCPMCRIELVINDEELIIREEYSIVEEIFTYKPDKHELEAQKKRQQILEYQKQKGGIINVEEERNKYLIGIKSMTISLKKDNGEKVAMLSQTTNEGHKKIEKKNEMDKKDWKGKQKVNKGLTSRFYKDQKKEDKFLGNERKYEKKKDNKEVIKDSRVTMGGNEDETVRTRTKEHRPRGKKETGSFDEDIEKKQMCKQEKFGREKPTRYKDCKKTEQSFERRRLKKTPRAKVDKSQNEYLQLNDDQKHHDNMCEFENRTNIDAIPVKGDRQESRDVSETRGKACRPPPGFEKKLSCDLK